MDANHQSVSYLLDHFQDPGMEEDPLMSISCLFYLKTALENSPKSVEKSCFGGKILSVLLQILRKDFHSSDRTKEVALYSLAMEILHLLSVLKYPAIDLLLSDTSLPAHLIRFLDMAGHFYRFTLAFSKELDQLCSHVSFSQQKVTAVPMTKKVLDNLVTYEPNIASCAALSHVYKCHLVFPQEETAVVVAERLITKGLAWKATTDVTASQPPLLRCVGDLVHPLTKDTAIPQPSCVKESCLNDVFVLDLLGGHYFWGYIGRECVSRVDSISDLLQTELPALTVCQPGVGDLVVVSEIERCSERPQVMRGKVIKVTEEEVTVFAVDYGSFKTVKSCSLYQLSDKIQCLATVDAQAKLCCLAGVQAPPIDTATVEFALASLTNLVTHANSPGVKFLSAGGLGHIRDLLHCGTPSIQLQCLRLLSNISSDVQLACTQDWTSFVRPLVEAAIRRAETSLREADSYISQEGRQALAEALRALQQFGKQSQQMTEIAQRAKDESIKQMNDASMIDNVARNALNTSREARRLAEETLKMPDTNKAEIERLTREFSDASELYDRTEELATVALERADRANKDALNLLREAQSPLPSIDVNQLEEEAEQIKEDARRIKLRAEELMRNNRDLLEEVEQQTNLSRSTLDEGSGLQQRVDELLAEVDAARDVARRAVESGEQTLREANETLQTLLGFDRLVSENKDAAEEAIQKVPEIRRMIDQAINTTQQARDALQGAEVEAREGLRLAELAEQTATQASDEAGRIREDARQTKEKAVTLKEDAESLSLDVQDAEQNVASYEQQADSDEAMIEEARRKAREAQITADAAAQKVNQALDQVTDIKNILDNLEDPDTGRLADLESELERLERELNQANLDSEIESLSQQNDRIKCWRNKYEGELSQFRKDVDNILAIKESLPDGCYKVIDIESPLNPLNG